MKTQFYILGKPLSITDAINRRAAATGSVRYAQMAADADFDSAFAAMAQQPVVALVVSGTAFLNTRRDQIIKLAAHHAIPTMYSNREYVPTGGLMSYGVEL
jgi:putative ABC transport system substrate-binding protein